MAGPGVLEGIMSRQGRPLRRFQRPDIAT